MKYTAMYLSGISVGISLMQFIYYLPLEPLNFIAIGLPIISIIILILNHA